MTNPFRRRQRLLLAALLLVFVALAGCTRTINRTAERKIRDALPTYIGPARVWNAHVDNPPMSTIRGRLSRVTIDGEAVQLRNTIVCDNLHIELRDVSVDTNRQKLRSVGSTVFSATISEAALNDYLRNFPPPDDDPVRMQSVTIREGSLKLAGTRKVLGHPFRFTATATPRLVSPTQLEFDPTKMSVVGLTLPLPPRVLQFLARYVDHAFDFSTLPFPLRITEFHADNGRMVVTGTCDIMQSINARM